ncbi:hemolysin family protein [soil metagenome]
MPETGGADVSVLLVVAVLIAINGLAVFNEFALVAIPATRVRALEAEGGRRARMVARSVHRLDDYIAADQLAITITSIAVGWIGQPGITSLLRPVFEWLGLPLDVAAPLVAGVVAFALITGTQMIFGELVPKSIALRFPERVAMTIALPVEVMATLLRPLTIVLNGIGRLILRPFGIDAGMASHHRATDIADLAESIEASAAAGLLLRPGTVRNAILFGERRARDVMRPRNEVAALSADEGVAAMIARARRDPHVRYPVYRGDLDGCIGFLNVTDLASLDPPPDGGPQDWVVAVRPITAVYEAVSLEQVLTTFQRERQQIGLVVDESGGVQGIITLADLLSGMIESPPADAHPPGAKRLVSGGDSLHDLLAVHGIDLVGGTTSSTISGVIVERLGRFPRAGDVVELGGVRLTVRRLRGRVADTVEVEVLDPQSGDARNRAGGL